MAKRSLLVWVALLSPGLLLHARAQNQVSLDWPFAFYHGYTSAGSLEKETGVTFSANIPQFPTQVPHFVQGSTSCNQNERSFLPQVDLAGLYAPVSVVVQCFGCGSGVLDPCITIYSGAGPNSTCDKKFCDDKPHACSDFLPTSTASASAYKITIANENVLKAVNFSIAIDMGCANASRTFDKDVCAPVLAGNYPTACVFTAGQAANNQTIFGVDGCNCVPNPSDGGCSSCWDNSAPSECDIVAQVQVCGPYCK